MADDSIQFLDSHAIDELVARAAASPRRRQNLNLHSQLSDPVQRLLNAGEPGSYIAPHRHAADRWETFTVLRGRIDLMLFSDEGSVTQRFELRAGSGNLVEIGGGCWHSFCFMAPGTVALEIKPGPYVAETDKEFASWAPREGEASAAHYARWLETAAPGQRWTRP